MIAQDILQRGGTLRKTGRNFARNGFARLSGVSRPLGQDADPMQFLVGGVV